MFPEVRELVRWNQCGSQSGVARWKGEQQVMTMASLRAAVYHNAYQEDKPVCPDDKSAIHLSGREGEPGLPT